MTRARGLGRELVQAAVLVAAAAATVLVLLVAFGHDPLVAASVLFRAAFGTPGNFAVTLVKATPLLVLGTAVAIAFRAAVWNVGADGQFLAGAIAATAVGVAAGPLPSLVAIPLVLAAAAAGGALAASPPAVLRLARGTPEVIGTIMMNFVIGFLLGYLLEEGPLREAAGTFPQSDPLAPSARLPRFDEASRLHAGLPVAILLALAAHLFLSRTLGGLRHRAAGLNARAAEAAGIPVRRVAFLALLVSGSIAGLAGAIEVAAITRRLFTGFSGGIGYTAIAVALLGRLSIPAVAAAALFFGALDVGAASLQRAAHVPPTLALVVQGTLLALSALFAESGRRAARRRAEAAA